MIENIITKELEVYENISNVNIVKFRNMIKNNLKQRWFYFENCQEEKIVPQYQELYNKYKMMKNTVKNYQHIYVKDVNYLKNEFSQLQLKYEKMEKTCLRQQFFIDYIIEKEEKTPSIINVEEIKLIVKNEIESNFKDKETIIEQPIDNNNNIERRHFIRLESDDEEESFISNNESKKELEILKKEMLDFKTINEVFF